MIEPWDIGCRPLDESIRANKRSLIATRKRKFVGQADSFNLPPFQGRPEVQGWRNASNRGRHCADGEPAALGQL
jgi:hypothetical protein